jgi:hypothetical protein
MSINWQSPFGLSRRQRLALLRQAARAGPIDPISMGHKTFGPLDRPDWGRGLSTLVGRPL